MEEQNKTTEENSQQVEQISEGRRKLTKATLIAPPILAALPTRSVFAETCFSNMMSGNLSDPSGGSCVLGLSPGYWGQHPDDWSASTSNLIYADSVDEAGNLRFPKNCNTCQTHSNAATVETGASGTASPSFKGDCSGGTLFHTIFAGASRFGDTYTNQSMYRVICENNGSFAFHLIAAYLNSLKFTDYVLNPDDVINIWTGAALGSDTESQIKAYLNTTWV